MFFSSTTGSSTGTVAEGSGLTFSGGAYDEDVCSDQLTDNILGTGGGMYLDTSTSMTVSDLVCDSISAKVGACIYSSGTTLTVVGATVTNNFGNDYKNPAAALFLGSRYFMT